MQESQATFGLAQDPADAAAAEAVAKVASHEEAAHEKRQWVRLTSYCNNRCTFCLDSAAHNGTFVPRAYVRSQIMDGRAKGATRLILSGGEPTIHPDYVEFIALGAQLGYRKVQTVTNGRLFSYPKFLDECLSAGLSEITFSIHGHNAKVHDALVGVQGAFDEEIEGLQLALADGRCVVNVDVCLNKGNIRGLPELLDNLIEMGVREFDLLHIIPFGRAYEEGRETLFYDMDEAMPSVRYALELSDRPDLHVWFNRFPPPFLEGYEHLIQDPYKLNDEVRGRFGEYDRLLKTGVPLSCRQRDRCERCYLEDLCDTLDDTRAAVTEGTWPVLRVRPGASTRPTFEPEVLWLQGDVVDPADLDAKRLWLELDDHTEVVANPPAGLEKVYTASPTDLEGLLATPDRRFEVVAVLTKEMADHLLSHHRTAPERFAVAGRNYERLTEAQTQDADLASFFAAWPCADDVPVEGVPACLTGGRLPRPLPKVLDAEVLAPDAPERPDIFGYTRRFILDHFMTKSRRCQDCVFDAECAGAHVNFVRAHGYATLQPILPDPS